MVSALEFCRQPGFRRTLVLTWSFDAVFFERVVLPGLLAGGTRVPLILADGRAIRAAMGRWPGQVQHLGRSYILEAIHQPGEFHPKLILRAGPNGGAVWVSTGNVTPGGFGGNQELGISWSIGPDAEDTGDWLPSLLEEVETWCKGPSAKEVIEQIRALPWLSAMVVSGADSPPILWSRPDATLADLLKRRWEGRRFDAVNLMTGSTDRSGEFLRWAHNTFGIRKALIAVNSSQASFHIADLERLPVEVRFVEPKGSKPLHAKCYWFTGPDGEGAVFGSPNCSASAWVRPITRGGNNELLVVFDHPSKEMWAPILAGFAQESISPADFLGEYPEEDSSSNRSPDYSITFIDMDLSSRVTRVSINPEVPDSAKLILFVRNEEIYLTRRVESGIVQWEGPLPECAWDSHVLFGTLEIRNANEVFRTLAHWVDKRHDLREAARSQSIENLLPRLSQPTLAREHRQIIEDLQAAMATILEAPGEFPDPPLRARSTRVQTATKASRLDHKEMGASLNAEDQQPGDLRFKDTSLTFSGVIRAFFKDSVDEAVSTIDEEALLGAEEGTISLSPPIQSTNEAADHSPRGSIRSRFFRSMMRFLEKLESKEFSESCTATQMVQAISLPIAVASLGERNGWVDSEHAINWTTRSLAALLHNVVSASSPQGLLAQVKERYYAENREDIYQSVVGDGSLWITSVVALVQLRWSGLEGDLRRALLVRALVGNPILEAQVDSLHLHRMAERLRCPEAVIAAKETFPAILEKLEQLEVWLDHWFDHLLAEQIEGSASHEKGDPLYRPGNGWRIVLEPKAIRKNLNVAVQPLEAWTRPLDRAQKIRSAGFFINLRVALNAHQMEVPKLL